MSKKPNILNKLSGRNILVFALVLCMLVVAVAGGASLARYVSGNNVESSLAARDFYFSSNLLMQDADVSYALSQNTTSIPISLYNFADSLRFNSNDVNYSVTVSGTSGATVTPATGTLAGGSQSTNTVTLGGLVNGGSYTVTVTTTSGYAKTLTADFTVRTGSDGFYKYVEEDEYAVYLTVWTDDISGKMTFEAPVGLAPRVDICPVLSTVANYNSGTGKYDAFTFEDVKFSTPRYSYCYVFIKTADYIPADFNVTLTLSDSTVKEAESGVPNPFD